MECDDRIDFKVVNPSWIVKGIGVEGLGLIVHFRCLESCIILKVVVCLLGLSIRELG